MNWKPAGDVSSISRVAKGSCVWNVEKNEEVTKGLAKKSQQNDGIPAETIGPRAKDAKQGTTSNLPATDEDTRKAN